MPDRRTRPSGSRRRGRQTRKVKRPRMMERTEIRLGNHSRNSLSSTNPNWSPLTGQRSPPLPFGKGTRSRFRRGPRTRQRPDCQGGIHRRQVTAQKISLWQNSCRIPTGHWQDPTVREVNKLEGEIPLEQISIFNPRTTKLKFRSPKRKGDIDNVYY